MTTPRKKPSERASAIRRAAALFTEISAESLPPYHFPVRPPDLLPGVVPVGARAAVAMDSASYAYIQQGGNSSGFPGYPYLAQLQTRAEYRQLSGTLANELTREWIKLTSSEGDGDGSNDKLRQIAKELDRLNVRQVITRAAEHDAAFGRGQIFINIAGHDRETPLILSPQTVAKGSLKSIVNVEPMWTTPVEYNALDPIAPDFYRPSKWFMLGQPVHASRMCTIITRPLPDMLKPAFNFSGMSLSQLAEPYVDNWLRTRQSVSDLISNFSTTILATDMGQVLEGDDGSDLVARAKLFTQTRSNRGLMLLDKEREEVVQINTPLSGLHELQAQSQEQMCSVSRMPAIILTGISPSGLNASSDGEIRVFYDWIASQQEAHYRDPLDVIIKVIQLSSFGEIDPDIGFEFPPLYQMTPKELAEIRQSDSTSDGAYVAMGALDPLEVRERLARDPLSGYAGIDVSALPDPPEEPSDDSQDEPGSPRESGN